MQTYICKCGKTFEKSTKAETTGYELKGFSPQHECYGCPYIVTDRAWQPRSPIIKRECRATPKITYLSKCHIGTGKGDFTACKVYSLDLPFVQRVMNYVNSLDGAEKGLRLNCIPSEWRAADFGMCYSSDNCFGLAIFNLYFQNNKAGTAARRLVKERFFTESGVRRDMTEEEERETVLMRIEIAKENARKALEQNAGEPTEDDIALFEQYQEYFGKYCRFDKVYGADHKYTKQHYDEAQKIYGEIVDKGLEQAYKKWRKNNHEDTNQQSMCDRCANNDGSCIKPTEGECARYVSESEAGSYFSAPNSENESAVIQTAEVSYFDVLLQHYPNFDASRFNDFADDVCTAECFDDVNSRLGNTAGKCDFACKINCSECWKNKCVLQWKLSKGTEKYIEPYLTAKTVKKEEDKMTPNFNFKGFISEGNQLKQVPLYMLVPYHNHKFKLYEGERLDDMVNSIKENGVLTPIIVRNMGGEHYEILAGHNRTNAARLAGLSVIPAIVKENLSDDEAEMYVIETNVMQRGFDDLSISERAAVVAARHMSMFDEDKRKAIARELAVLNGIKVEEQEENTAEKKSKLAVVGESYGLSKDSVARLIRISKLDTQLQALVDNGGIPLRAGVNLSYMLASEQKMLVKCMTTGCEVTQLSMKQSELLRGLSENKTFTEKNMKQIVLFGKLSDNSEAEPRKPIRVKISADIGAKYFAPDWDADKVQEIVELALERYFNDTDHLIMDDNDEYQI